jgi:hypothetical protein
MTTRARVMALIDTFADVSPLVREMAGWVLSGKNDVAIDADTDDKDAAYMDALRRRWPEATDEEIARGLNLAVAVAETVKTP